MFPGYATRLENEIKSLYKENALKLAEDKTIKIPINVIDSPRRKYSVFIGASVMAKFYNEPEYLSYWISKKEWEESGPRIIQEKCKALIR
jgi:actin-related protein 2